MEEKMNQGDLNIQKERDLTFYQYLKQENILFQDKEILDFGCGEGFVMELYHRWGVNSQKIFGVDISKERINEGKRRFPEFTFINIEKKLPFDNNNFSLIIIYTVFSSIKNNIERAYWSSELNRVLKPEGSIFIYDMKVNNPFNNNINPIKISELSSLFKNYKLETNSLTVWPQLTRLLSNNYNFYKFLTSFKILHTHYAAVLTKPKE
jgi:ubiquinone/menaquinone biosynthesis C-methylase UbiE